MTNYLVMLGAVLVGGLVAVPALGSKVTGQLPGSLRVHDEAGLFSDGAVREAETKLSDARFDHGFQLTVDTYQEIPADRRASYDPARKADFFRDWARSVATGDKARGIYVLICMKPGYTQVLVDVETENRGFTKAKATELRDIFDAGLQEAAKLEGAARTARRDKTLTDAAAYVVREITGTTVVDRTGQAAAADAAGGGFLSGIGGWICIGLCGLLAVWFFIGLFRALSSPAGGPGGGGFLSGLLGGLFGAMAGMWLYNNLFGGGSLFGGSDAYANDGSGGGADTGAGDFAGGTDAGTGGDYGGGDYGGGDYGGGDYGGGDYGGGDFGGGGDF